MFADAVVIADIVVDGALDRSATFVIDDVDDKGGAHVHGANYDNARASAVRLAINVARSRSTQEN